MTACWVKPGWGLTKQFNSTEFQPNTSCIKNLQIEHLPIAHFRKKPQIIIWSISSQGCIIAQYPIILSKHVAAVHMGRWYYCPKTGSLHLPFPLLKPSWLVRICKFSWRIWQTIQPGSDPGIWQDPGCSWDILAHHGASHSWDRTSHGRFREALLGLPATSLRKTILSKTSRH